MSVRTAEATMAADSDVRKNRAAVVFSKKYPDMGLKKAYNLQKAYVKNRVSKGIKIVGYKAGLATKGAPQKFGLSEPISGVLISEPLAGNGLVLRLQDANMLMVEQEIAFRFSRSLPKHVTLAELKESVDAIAPVIELPDISFSDESYNGMDIIANNALSYKFIIGEWQPLPEKIDHIAVSLSCGSSILTQGTGGNVIGGQWQLLLWMVNHLAKQGYHIQPGQIVMTGNLVKMLEAKPCQYTGDFGPLGKIVFQIEA